MSECKCKCGNVFGSDYDGDEVMCICGRIIKCLIADTEPVAQSPAAMAGYEDLVRKIVDWIIKDLTSRKGLRHEYHLCDQDIREEIKDAWRQIAVDGMGKSL